MKDRTEDNTILCLKCGSKINLSVTDKPPLYCPKCGAKISGEDIEKKSSRSKWKIALWIISWILCFPIPASYLLIKSKQTKKMALVILNCMWVIFIALWLCVIALTNLDFKVKVPTSAALLKGRNYVAVVDMLEDAGFENIDTCPVYSFETIQFGKPNSVKVVEIDGVSDFDKNDKFSKKAEVIISYYAAESVTTTSPQLTTSTITTTSSTTTESTSRATTKTTTQTTSKTTTTEATTTKTTTTTSLAKTTNKVTTTIIHTTPILTTAPTESKILTVENSEDLRNLLSNGGNRDIAIDFVQKYKDYTIEFDAYVAVISHHNSYKTRYDILVYAGDAPDGGGSGPAFQFRNVNMFNLNLEGANTDYLTANQNVHITAKVSEFTSGDLLILDPVKTVIR